WRPVPLRSAIFAAIASRSLAWPVIGWLAWRPCLIVASRSSCEIPLAEARSLRLWPPWRLLMRSSVVAPSRFATPESRVVVEVVGAVAPASDWASDAAEPAAHLGPLAAPTGAGVAAREHAEQEHADQRAEEREHDRADGQRVPGRDTGADVTAEPQVERREDDDRDPQPLQRPPGERGRVARARVGPVPALELVHEPQVGQRPLGRERARAAVAERPARARRLMAVRTDPGVRDGVRASHAKRELRSREARVRVHQESGAVLRESARDHADVPAM